MSNMRACSRSLLIAGLVLGAGCSMQRAADDLARLEQQGAIRGELMLPQSEAVPAVLIRLRQDREADSYPPVAHQVRCRAGPFELA